MTYPSAGACWRLPSSSLSQPEPSSGLPPRGSQAALDLTETLRQEGRGSNGSRRRSRLRPVLVIGELALSLVLMIAAGLLLRSFWDLFKVQPGFNPTRVMAVETSLPNPNDPKTDIYHTATQEAVLLREVLRRNRTHSGRGRNRRQ